MKKNKNTKSKGNFYEEIALQYLLSNGFIFVEKNFYSKYGEIDLVMQKDNVLHFIEVKSSNTFNPLYNITDKKLEKLQKTIEIFIQNRVQNLNISNLNYCIDAISIYDNQVCFIENITI